MSTLEKIKHQLGEFEQKKRELVESLRNDFSEILKPIFEKSKVIESISWTQYTPYFNDGDTCVFSANIDYLDINNIDDFEWDECPIWREKDYSQESPYLNPNYDPSEGAVVAEFKEVLRLISDEFYLELFGDHVRVTVNKNGTVDVEEYDHD